MASPGFTLVELLLYVALFAVTASALSSVYVSGLSTDSLARREQDIIETERHLGIRLRETLQGANVVTEPASGASSVLTVDGPGVADGPAAFSLADGRLYLETASAPATALTPADLTVETFTATRLPGSPPGVEISFTLSAQSGSTTVRETSNFIVMLRYE